MKKSIILFLALVMVCLIVIPSFAAMTVDWRVVPLLPDTYGDYRHLAYNPATGHLIMTNTLSPQTAWILNALDGTTIGTLAAPITGYNPSPSPYGLDVDDDGVIYASNGFYAGFNTQVLRWAAEDTVTPPTVACDVGDGLWTRSLNVVGTGVNTKIIIPTGPSNADGPVQILGTTDGVNFVVEDNTCVPTFSLHAVVATPDVLTIYATRGLSATNLTNKWDKIGGTWTEDAGFTKSNWICDLAYSTRGKLYGAYWNTDLGIVDGIRVWNPTTGALIDSLDLGDTNEAMRGGYISVYNAPNPLDDKLYFAFHGNVGYGRISIPTDPVITVGPTPMTITVGQTQQFDYSGIPDPIVWSSTDTTVGSIDAAGLFTAVGVGSCQVKATYSRGTSSWFGSADVTVIATSAPLAPDATLYNKIHRIAPIGEISTPRVTRSWELFQ